MLKLPKLSPLLRKKRIAIPILVVLFIIIAILATLPFMPQIQTATQDYTAKNPAIARITPQYFKRPQLDVPSTGSWLVIPGAGIKMEILEGDSIKVLNKNVGVWHQTGTQNDNYVLAGHRLQYFRSVNQTLYNLDKLRTGYTGIFVVVNGVKTEYKVINTKTVTPDTVTILDPTTTSQLTIYTCNDFNNERRFVVTAVPIDRPTV